MKKKKKANKFLEELKQVPIVSLACEKVGVSRNTVYRWRKEDKDFAKAMDNALEIGALSINDLAESKLINGIQRGEFQYLKYWLDNNKKNYARPRPHDFWEKFNSDKIGAVTIQFVDMDGKKIDMEKERQKNKPPDPLPPPEDPK